MSSIEFPHPSIAEIQTAVSLRFGIPAREMVSQRRARPVARPRQVAMYLARELTPFSLPNIGRMFGKRDHTTVMHACRKVEQLMVDDRRMRRQVAVLRGRLERVG